MCRPCRLLQHRQSAERGRSKPAASPTKGQTSAFRDTPHARRTTNTSRTAAAARGTRRRADRARASNRRQTSTLRETPNARHMADTPALAASAQLTRRTPVPSRQRSTCVASVRHSRRGKCTLRGRAYPPAQAPGWWTVAGQDVFPEHAGMSVNKQGRAASHGAKLPVTRQHPTRPNPPQTARTPCRGSTARCA